MKQRANDEREHAKLMRQQDGDRHAAELEKLSSLHADEKAVAVRIAVMEAHVSLQEGNKKLEAEVAKLAEANARTEATAAKLEAELIEEKNE